MVSLVIGCLTIVAATFLVVNRLKVSAPGNIRTGVPHGAQEHLLVMQGRIKEACPEDCAMRIVSQEGPQVSVLQAGQHSTHLYTMENISWSGERSCASIHALAESLFPLASPPLPRQRGVALVCTARSRSRRRVRRGVITLPSPAETPEFMAPHPPSAKKGRLLEVDGKEFSEEMAKLEAQLKDMKDMTASGANTFIAEEREEVAQAIDSYLDPLQGLVDGVVEEASDTWGQVLLWLQIVAGIISALLVVAPLAWLWKQCGFCGCQGAQARVTGQAQGLGMAQL